MSTRCPYLRMALDRDQVLVGASSRHRCFARIQPERVGITHQTETCLTARYRGCPRLATSHPPGDGAILQMPRPRLVAPKRPARRRVTGTEVAVLGMGVAIAFALLFAGFALVQRLVAESGSQVATVVAQQVAPTDVGALPAEEATPVPPTTTPLPASAPTPDVTPTLPAPASGPTEPVPTPHVRPPATLPPTRLTIAKIGLDIPVRPVGVKTVREGGRLTLVWDDLPNAGAFHETSAYPGNPGNTVINGHRDIRGSVFRRLDRVEVGDEIVLYVGEVAYPYVVAETLVVPEAFASAAQRAENLRLIGYMPEERLTLVTCTPVGLATHRLLVIARPPDQLAPQMPEAGSEPGP